MKKTNILMVSIVAMMAAGAARADIASTTYVSTQLQPVTEALGTKQSKIAAGTAGNVVTYSGTEGSFGTATFVNSAGYNAEASASVKDAGIPSVRVVENIVMDAVGDNAVPASYTGDASKNKALITDDNGGVVLGQVATGMIADNAVTTGKIANGTILSEDIADSTIAKGKLASGVQTSLGYADDWNTTKATYGNIVTHNVNEFATAQQGSTADTAAADIATLKGSGDGSIAKAIADALSNAHASTALQGVQVNSADLTADANNKVNIAIVEGSTDGAISVNGTAVPVHGLGSAAYENTTAFDAAGDAAAVQTAIEGKLDDGATGYDIDAKTLKIQTKPVATQEYVGTQITNLNLGTTYQAKSTANYQMGKQDGTWETMSPGQQAALNSGVTSEKVGGYDTAVAAVNNETTGLATKQTKSTGVSVGGANGAWNALTQGSGISISTSNGTTTIATSTTYVPMPAAEENITGKAVLTYDSEANNGAGAYYWEGIGR